MPTATNPQTGETVYLTPEGAWKPAPTATNPQTQEKLIFDGQGWNPVQPPSVKPESRSLGERALQGIDYATRNIADAATFGQADRLGALVNPFINRQLGLDDPYGQGEPQDYNQALEQERGVTEAAPAAIKYPAQIAGGIGATLAAAPAAVAGLTGTAIGRGIASLPRAAQFTGLGAAEGALSAAGHAKPGEAGQDAVGGAVVGGAVGLAAPYVIGGVKGLYGGIKNTLSRKNRVASSLGRAISRDDTTPQALGAAARSAARERRGVATIADAGGENVRGLVEGIANRPGAGRSIVIPRLKGRQASQAIRLSKDLGDLTGTQTSAYQAIEETMADRATAAAPLYTRAYADGDVEVWSPGLERLTSAPSVKAAMQKAVSVWQDNAIADGFGAMNPKALVKNGLLKFQSGGIPTFPNIQFWDYTKRMLDDSTRKAIVAGQNGKARTLTRLTVQLRTELDNVVPSYAAAREAWAGPSAYIDAIEEGRGILATNVSKEEFIGRLSSLSQGEMDGLRLGAISSLRSKMESNAARLPDFTRIFHSPLIRAKIAAIMPSEELAAKWTKILDFEQGSSDLTGQALGNSATARRLAEQADSEDLWGDLIIDAASGSGSVTILRKLLTSSRGALRHVVRSKTDAELGDLLTNPSRIGDLDDVLRRISVSQVRTSPLAKSAAVGGSVAAANSRSPLEVDVYGRGLGPSP